MTVSSDPGLQFQAVDAFVDLVEALALQRPLVVGVDDLQWADPSSLLTLGALGRRLVDLPVALIGCLRPSPHPHELERTLQTLHAAGRNGCHWASSTSGPWSSWWPRWRAHAATRCSSPSWASPHAPSSPPKQPTSTPGDRRRGCAGPATAGR
jgi:hypothetical protein